MHENSINHRDRTSSLDQEILENSAPSPTPGNASPVPAASTQLAPSPPPTMTSAPKRRRLIQEEGKCEDEDELVSSEKKKKVSYRRVLRSSKNKNKK